MRTAFALLLLMLACNVGLFFWYWGRLGPGGTLLAITVSTFCCVFLLIDLTRKRVR